jgi:hypothetical protein
MCRTKGLSWLMHDVEYVSYTKFVPHDEEEEEKVLHLCHHYEKLDVILGSSIEFLVLHSK